MNQCVKGGRLSLGLKKALNYLVQLVPECPERGAIATHPAEAASHLPGHLLFVFCRTRNTIQRDLRARGGIEVSALITGWRMIAQNFRPCGVAYRWEG